MRKNARYYHWQIAYKRKDEDKFKLIPNPWYAWAADPFLVEYDGRILLFAELFLYKSERNGVLGVCEYVDGIFTEWKIAMDEHWHLSYPNVFVKDNKLMMCPESYQKHEVSIYEMVEFPNKWILKKNIFQNVSYVDTTFLSEGDNEYVFTFEPSFKGDEGRLLMGKLPHNDENIISMQTISDELLLARPGGNFLKRDGKLLRVCQNSEHGYGEGLVFTEVEEIWPNYQEHIVKKIYPDDICIDSTRKYEGIHTYNCVGEIEVIDLKYYNPSWAEYFAARRTKKVFTKKY